MRQPSQIIRNVEEAAERHDGLINGRIGCCGCMEHAGFETEAAKWPDTCSNDITVSYRFDSIDETLADKAWDIALGYWEERLQIKFRIVSRRSIASTRIWANDVSLAGDTLAWSYLANNDCRARLEQAYDTTVRWTLEYLVAVIVHEVGHALGLTHSNSRDDIMFRLITMNTIKPSDGDIRQAVSRGYKERTEPLPPDPPEPPSPPDPPEPPDPEVPDMEWLEILKIILEVLAKCQAKRGRERTLQTLSARGVLAKWTLRGELRQRGIRGKEQREAVAFAMGMLQDATDEDLESLLADAVSFEGD